MKAAGTFLDAVAYPTMVTKDQWLARRAELQNKPSWKDAPEWAEWLAQDPCGEWWFYDARPCGDGSEWDSDVYSDSATVVSDGVVLGSWRDTLEKRPADLSEQAVTARLKDATDNVLAAVPELMTDKYKFTPFTIIEDNQEKAMKQDNGWFERGELPPVGTACEAFGKFPTAPCEIIAYSPEQVAIRWLDNGLLDVIDLKTGDIPSIDFRPIRTERDELVNVFINHYGNPKGAEGYIGIADAILAAGFSLGAK